MQKFLLYSSALVVLSGVAEAACIQTPTCSSLGYTSSQSCSGGIKCPFGNAWNCTAANNTTEITNLKTEVTNLKTQISAINTNITNITNRVTNIENNTSSSNQYSDKCIGCEVGMYYDGSKCYSFNEVKAAGVWVNGYISAKKEGKCYYEPYDGWTEISYNEWLELKDKVDIVDQMVSKCSQKNILPTILFAFKISLSMCLLHHTSLE